MILLVLLPAPRLLVTLSRSLVRPGLLEFCIPRSRWYPSDDHAAFVTVTAVGSLHRSTWPSLNKVPSNLMSGLAWPVASTESSQSRKHLMARASGGLDLLLIASSTTPRMSC
ncbi:hypothetical protein EV356DRAFT_280576 [Viridothelium virens]|uniref:Secreted protein n=1 Tax=Viridothelium virens TaxID=1048519 RepID=A0A6A6H196_VIRVR|nr:hypothetical protein EV356DRAFT_280576 [Viridothelium virens]